jgi:predicted small secreted protein
LNSYNENTLAYQKKDQEIIFIKERILQYIQSSKKRLLENLKNLEKSRRNLEADFIECLPSGLNTAKLSDTTVCMKIFI